ncbi:MAG TPA: BON domain-containing protein [Povalibacter sp.]|nr:BON domain-containing protein [Povalibacter sp.]
MHWLVRTLVSLLLCCGFWSGPLRAQETGPQEERSIAPSGDDALTAKVGKALADAPGLDSTRIHVETRDGVVQLSGFVSSEEARDAAIEAAVAVSGAARVRNDLTIRAADPSTSAVVADSVIAARIKTQLTAAKLPQGDDVHVEVENGVAQLSGFVQSVESKTRAADIASGVSGVTDVHNNIAVKGEQESTTR